MAVHYDISSLDSNKTILETLHDIQKYLKANPIYKVYYANGSYAIGQAQYSISLLGNNQGQIAEGDVVFFNNNFYAKISSVGTETFSVFPATAIQGSGGAQIKTMSQLEFLNVLSLLYDDNAGAHINMSGRTEYTDGTETPNTLEILIPIISNDNAIQILPNEDNEKILFKINRDIIQERLTAGLGLNITNNIIKTAPEVVWEGSATVGDSITLSRTDFNFVIIQVGTATSTYGSACDGSKIANILRADANRAYSNGNIEIYDIEMTVSGNIATIGTAIRVNINTAGTHTTETLYVKKILAIC